MSDHTRPYRMKLSGDVEAIDRHVHKPDLDINIEYPTNDDDDPAVVVICVKEQWGQHMRWIELSPEQARELAEVLTTHASDIENDMFERIEEET